MHSFFERSDDPLTIKNNISNYLDRIRKSELNAFLHAYDEDVDSYIQMLQDGPLSGLSVALKNNISYQNHPLQCASQILDQHIALYDSHLVNSLKEAGAFIIGHTNMDEFAMGSSNENSAFGPVKNPFDQERVSGGSSGGSAVAVADRLCDVAFGSDTGGSIRQPAAFCGVYGMKPSYGHISRRGLVAFASSLDQIGPFTRDVETMAHVLDSVCKFDSQDSTSVSHDLSFGSALNRDIKGMKIGVAQDFFIEGLQPEIKSQTEKMIDFLSAHGAEIVPIELKHIKYSIAVYYIIATAEASSNLSRFDGIRYGLREMEESSALHEMYSLTRESGFGEEVKRRIMLGTFVLSHGYYDAYYRKAQKVRQIIKNDFDTAFTKCDAIISPTTPTTAFKIGEFNDDPLSLYLADIYTAPANLAGLPGISVPYGQDNKGLPIGIQFLANHGHDDILISLAHAIEQSTGDQS